MNTCKLPPKGWVCTREAGHSGPCAAYTCLYDRDVMDVFVIEDKIHVEYYTPTQEGIFTKEDLDYLSILLSSHGTFNTQDCISAEELGKLIIKKDAPEGEGEIK